TNGTGNIFQEVVGDLVLGSVQNGNSLQGGGSSTVNVIAFNNLLAFIQFANLTRNPGATVNFNGASLGGINNRIVFQNIPALTSNVLPFAFVNGTDIATVDINSNGTGVAAFNGYVTDLASATASSNVKLSNNDVVPAGGKTINSLVLV